MTIKHLASWWMETDFKAVVVIWHITIASEDPLDK